MVPKNKKFILVCMLITLTSVQAAHGIFSWFSNVMGSTKNILLTTLNTAQEYKKATTAIMGLTIGASLLYLAGKYLKRNQRLQKELLDDEQYAHYLEYTEKITLDTTAQKLEKNVQWYTSCINQKLAQLHDLQLRHERQKQRIRMHSNLAKEKAQLQILENEIIKRKGKLATAKKNFQTTFDLAHPQNVHKNIDYWLTYHQECGPKATFGNSKK